MMTVSINETRATIELDVYGAYEPTRAAEIIAAMRNLAEVTGGFSVLEIHHARPDNLMKFLGAFSTASSDKTDYNFMQKLRRYALVSDDPPLFLRFLTLLMRGENARAKIFPKHEIDAARRWVSGETTSAARA